ncbi:ABC transporter ATP-binding protein [Methanosarcina sp. UBA411]|jgi:peptide/nickel transport system ATP-binding protein|uniref:ABC transporter ATP-binding protein n=1 Tax=Methanosarcina sp. UBA411 TaxID=1915589 RepID=UPI0025FE80AD|nr:ABC transporter ATP-binding protein [Methanosarcina sp. UBA411]
MELIEIKSLKVTFPTETGLVRAVDCVDLQLGVREKLGLIGETGSGKSVLTHAILRLLQPDALCEGEILYQGRNLLGLAPTEMRRLRGRELALIPQNRALNPLQKVGKQLLETLRQAGYSKKEAAAKMPELLRSVGAIDPDSWTKAYPHECSGGMCERIVIALSLAFSPSLLLADEPTKGLDSLNRARIITLLGAVTKNQALLFITHDLEAAAMLCTRLALMYAGELVELGDKDTVFENPLHPYTRGLLFALPARGMQPILGRSPPLTALPDGCRFHSRCPGAMARCRRQHPPLFDTGNRHFCRCWLYV